jgi:hypothetical protein
VKRRGFLATLFAGAAAPAVAQLPAPRGEFTFPDRPIVPPLRDIVFDDTDLTDEEVDEALESDPLQQRDFGKVDPVFIAVNGRAYAYRRGYRHLAPEPVRRLLAECDYPHLKHDDGTIEFPL